ncbi:hypothetical protein EHS13_13655 [Paenibacillus psychroresistens]|uniref:Uncharacterized protein n=1 Tax=Paenibacillus psychroresistens TaxID=1778678 RepID=A0A6B8RKG8_9BACL|nr:hypothetical protein [Paenibacillus psychroresistens]QGQ95848.1 hypothetical protein EHS13_13655 [Paenibacillus psychroresistens]
MSHGQLLKTDVDFKNAILFQIVISITQDGEHIESGVILSQSHHCIETANAYYFKDACEFKVFSMVH